MRLGALQPGYLPWLGFFDQIARCDLFVVCDDLPYSKDTWRNRNRIRTPQGWCWLTVPVVNAGVSRKTIREVEVSEHGNWRTGHWRSLRTAYGRAPYFQCHEEFFATLYETRWRFLVDVNLAVIYYLVDALGIPTRLVLSSEMSLEAEYLRAGANGKDPSGRMIFVCQRLGAKRFLEGELGRTFMDPVRFEAVGITLEFHDYKHPFYRQLFSPFISHLSVVDLLFNHGPESFDILTGRKSVSTNAQTQGSK
ncbi:MAG: WbqC family protein [Acidobacteriota bacterium]